MTLVAVLGHTEWVDFIEVPRQPEPGGLEEGTRLFAHAGGGAVVAAAVLARHGAEVHLYTALGDDELADRATRELAEWGITVHAARRSGPTRYAFTTLDARGERTIVTVGDRYAPRLADGLDLGPLHAADGVYATAADPGLLSEAARSAALVVTTRVGNPRGPDGVMPRVRAAVFSASDAGETRDLEAWARCADLLVATEGADGGHWREGEGRPQSRGRWTVAPLPGEPRDDYGCGDSFAAGVTFGLAQGSTIGEAVAVGARAGAEMLTHVGAP